MSTIMRGKLWIAMVMTMLVICLAGCGVRQAKQNLDAGKVATGAAVNTDGKVTAIIQNAEITSEEQQRMHLKANIEPGVILTKYCLYEVSDDEDFDNTVIIQMDHEGNELKHIPLEGVRESDLLELLCGSDKYIIFSKYAEDKSLYLYCVPVIQKDDGETVRWEQAEKIAPCYEEEYGYTQAVLCESYLFYRESRNTLVRLDMETGERKDFTFPLTDLELYNSAYKDGYLYLVNRKNDDDDKDSEKSSAVYRINIDEGTSKKLFVCQNREEFPHDLFVDGQFLYMLFTDTRGNGSVEDRIACFDLEQKKTVGQLSVGEIERLIKEEMPAGSVEECWEFSMDGLSTYAGRLYIMVRTSWLREKGEDREGRIPRAALLSCSDKDMTDLKNEREWSEWFPEQGYYETVLGLGGYEEQYYFVYDSYDKAHDQRDTHLMRYHLDTKQIEEVKRNELIWQGYNASYILE